MNNDQNNQEWWPVTNRDKEWPKRLIRLTCWLNALLYTSKSMLTTMYALMCYQTALLSQWLITLCVWVYGASEYGSECMPYYKNCTHTGAHPCACVYVVLDYSLEWMIYYTHHKHKGAHHCECDCVLPNCPFYWKPCYRLHMDMDVHSVHEVHSEHPGKKQRLNIRIYFDRKNKYFYSNIYSH